MAMARRKLVRVLVIVLAVPVLLVAAVKIFLPAEKVRDLALAQARAQLGREVSVGEVAVSLRGGLGVRLSDFAVHNPDGFGGEHLLATRGLDLKLAIRPLLKGEIRVHRLVLDQPAVNLLRHADGRDNFTFAPAKAAAADPSGPAGSDGPAEAPALSIASLSVQDGTLTFTDQTAPATSLQGWQVTGLGLGLSLADPAPGTYAAKGQLTIGSLTLTGPQALPALDANLDFDLTWAKTAMRVDIPAATLHVGELPVTLTALVTTAPDQPQRFLVMGKAAAAGISLPGKVAMPPVDADLDFDLTWDQPSSRLDLLAVAARLNDLPVTVTGHVVTGAGSPTGQLNVDLPEQPLVDLIALAPPEMIQGLVAGPESGRASAKAELKLTGNATVPVHAKGTLSARNVDLALGQPFLPPDRPGRLAGRGDLDLSFADTTGTPAGLTYAGTANVRAASFTETQLVDELQNLDARLKFNQAEITVESCQARFASGTVDVSGRLRDPLPYFLPPEMQKKGAASQAPIKKPHLTFTMRTPRLDVDRLIPAASPSGATAAAARGQAAAQAVVARTEMEFPDLTCDGTFAADSLIYMQVPFTGVTGKVNLRDRILTCTDVKGAVYNGTVDGKVDIDLKDLNEPAYSGRYQARGIEVNNFASRFAALSGVFFGGLDTSGSFAAKGRQPDAIRNSLTLDSAADLKQGRVVTSGSTFETLSKLAAQAGQTLTREQTLRDLATHISVTGGRVGINELKTSLGQFGELTVDGYYGFNGDLSYTGQLSLTKGQTDLLFSQGALAELGKLLGSQRPERLVLPVSVGGTRTDPNVKLDLGTVTSDLQQKIVKEQGNKLQDEARNKVNDLLKKWK